MSGVVDKRKDKQRGRRYPLFAAGKSETKVRKGQEIKRGGTYQPLRDRFRVSALGMPSSLSI